MRCWALTLELILNFQGKAADNHPTIAALAHTAQDDPRSPNQTMFTHFAPRLPTTQGSLSSSMQVDRRGPQRMIHDCHVVLPTQHYARLHPLQVGLNIPQSMIHADVAPIKYLPTSLTI